MDKKAIYEHLANIYLDASSGSKKKRKSKKSLPFLGNPFLISVFIIAGLTFSFLLNSHRSSHSSGIALFLSNEAIKINFNFNPAKKEVFTLPMNNLNLSAYKALAFSVRKTNPRDKISVRVEFTNGFREKSHIYVKDIPSRWHDYSIKFSDFGNITDWSGMTAVSFSVEEWNAREKKGIVYLDNIRLLR